MMRACLVPASRALRRGGLLSYGRSGRLRRGGFFSPKAQSGETRSCNPEPYGSVLLVLMPGRQIGAERNRLNQAGPHELTGEGLGDFVHHGFGADQEPVRMLGGGTEQNEMGVGELHGESFGWLRRLCAVTTAAPLSAKSRRGRIPEEVAALGTSACTLCSQRKSSPKWACRGPVVIVGQISTAQRG